MKFPRMNFDSLYPPLRRAELDQLLHTSLFRSDQHWSRKHLSGRNSGVCLVKRHEAAEYLGIFPRVSPVPGV